MNAHRFLTSGRPQGTPLFPIIPHGQDRAKEGHQLLVALLDWWLTGANEVNVARPGSISTFPEGISLLEAEKLARAREPGNGTPQSKPR